MARLAELAGRVKPRPRATMALPVVLAAVTLSGCTTTEHEAQRVRLDSARLRSALAGTRVRVQGDAARPLAIDVVSADGDTALIVKVRNAERREVTDLPISVGYTDAAGARVYLNDGTDLVYYDAHLPAIPARSTLTWVFTTSAHVPDHARLFALVGAHESVPARLTDPDVDLRVRVKQPGAASVNSVTVHLDNPTSVPQYQLQLYATAADGGRYLAAGSATVADLGAGSSQSVKLPLVGAAPGARIRVTAVPTILQ